jgi:hypothetical protein
MSYVCLSHAIDFADNDLQNLQELSTAGRPRHSTFALR